MCVALGGRLAEEIINGRANVTTGASNDFQQCDLAWGAFYRVALGVHELT